jgi:hypothetical protein
MKSSLDDLLRAALEMLYRSFWLKGALSLGDAKSIGVLRLRDCKERNRFAQDDRSWGSIFGFAGYP